ncbi:MAG TPA: serine hydrolase domain-containing protein [Gemmatimonadales bacterium]
MRRFHWALARTTIATILAALAFGSDPAAAQRPQQPPPGPPAERAGPLGPPPAPSQLTGADVGAWLDGLMPYALQSGDVAGAVVVVVKDGQVLFKRGYGYADVKKKLPVNPDLTLFRPGSVSKLFTWTAVMQLVEQGKLDLDTDVNQYLDFKIPPAFGKPITLRNCMTHTPGFEEIARNLFSDDTTHVMSNEQWLKDWTPHRVYPPGQVPAYSNYATAMAGYIVQRVSGEKFEDYIEHHIFQPLGMQHATFRQPLPPSLRNDMATGYEVASGDPKPFEMVVGAPAGSLSASGADMGRFMIAHLQNGRFGSATILRPETAKRMHGTALTIVPAVNRMLLGFYETNRNGHRAIAHGGDTYWFHSDVHLFIDDGVGIFISVNSPGKEGAAGPIRTALFEQFADRYFPAPIPAGGVDPKTAEAHAKLVAGTYDNSRRAVSTFFSVTDLMGAPKVTVNADTTISLPFLTGLNGEPKHWRETQPFIWQEKDGKNLAAARVENGRVRMLTGDEISPFMMFTPAPAWRSPAWLSPLVQLSLAVLVLTLIAWPIAALVRRRYRVPFPYQGRAAVAHRWIRLAAVAVLLVLAGWFWLIKQMSSTVSALTSKSDPWIWLLHLLSLVAFLGVAGVALWHARIAWSDRRRWTSKLWSGLLAVAGVTLLYVAVVFHLIAFNHNF